MSGVEPVLQIDLGLANQVVGAEEIPVDDLNRQDRVLRKRCLEFETPVENSSCIYVGMPYNWSFYHPGPIGGEVGGILLFRFSMIFVYGLTLYI